MSKWILCCFYWQTERRSGIEETGEWALAVSEESEITAYCIPAAISQFSQPTASSLRAFEILGGVFHSHNEVGKSYYLLLNVAGNAKSLAIQSKKSNCPHTPKLKTNQINKWKIYETVYFLKMPPHQGTNVCLDLILAFLPGPLCSFQA